MIKKLFKSRSHVLALIIFHILFLAIIITNFPLGKWFIGWDSIHPEFDFILNFKRAIFSGGWQENYGVGALTGHGFAALLPHTLITFILSFIFPLSAIRPAFSLICLYFGGLGLYFLVRVVLNEIVKHFHIHFWQARQGTLDSLAILASLYYLFNLATIQQFYIQLEAFIVHFAALPWLFLSVIDLIKNQSRKHILFFVIVNFFATIQGFIPPLFVVYATSLGLFLIVYMLSRHWDKIAVKTSIVIVFLTFFINAYWFLPVAYFTLTQGETYLNSYNNLISTPEFVQKSQKFGDLKDVALLKGFYWDSYELGGQILSPWINHHKITGVSFIGYTIFSIVIVGFLAGLFWIHDWIIKGISIVGLYFFSSISVAVFPFSWITIFLQWLSPTYDQAFRTTFTKFSLGTGFTYSILFAVGLLFLITVFQKIFRHKFVLYSVILLLGISIICYALPLFQGNLFYKKVLISLPKSYFQVMDYFKDKGDGRIADFPQDCPEGWYSYNWGYFGSGFLWYGIKQPILARSFDVWSPHNENYYWELIQAIREKDYTRVDKIFDKYGVRWLLYDQNFIYCGSQRGVFTTNDFINYVESSPNYRLVKQFEEKGTLPIKLYTRTNGAESYIGTVNDLQNIGPRYEFNDQDAAFNDYGAYLTNSKSHYDVYYPLDVLFSKRGINKKDFVVSATENEITLTYKIPKDLEGYTLRLPVYSKVEKYIPIAVRLNHISGITYEVLLTYQLPKILVDGHLLTNSVATFSLGKANIRDINNTSIYINNIKIESINDIYQSVFFSEGINTVQAVSGSQTVAFEWNDRQRKGANQLINEDTVLAISSLTNGELKVVIPKIKDNDIYDNKKVSISTYVPQPCNESAPSGHNKYEIGSDNGIEFVRFISQDSRQCLTIPLLELNTSIGYLFEVNARHIAGGNLTMSVDNKNQLAGLDIYIPKDRKFTSYYFVMPPVFPSEVGYNLVFQNASFSSEQMVNDVSKVTVWYLPYTYLKNIKIERAGFGGITNQSNSVSVQPVYSEHPNDTFYKFNIDPSKGNYLLLSQGFDSGWFAFTSSLQPLKNHILVNNWENGWDLSDLKNQSGEVTIAIIFWPQYLEFLGLLLLPVPFIYALWPQKKKSVS